MHANYAIELLKQGKIEEVKQVVKAHKIILNWKEMIDLLEKCEKVQQDSTNSIGKSVKGENND